MNHLGPMPLIELHLRQSKLTPSETALRRDTDVAGIVRGFAVGILLSLPVWGLIGWAVWSLA